MTDDHWSAKACPGCGDHVRAADRACRYCGHRFDRPADGGMGAVARLLCLLRRPASDPDPADVLAGLGLDLAPGERPAGTWFGRVGREEGYVVLTGARLCFAPATGLWHRSAPPRQRRLADLVRIEPGREHGRPALVTHWKTAPPLVISNVEASELELISALLRPHVD